VAVVDAELGEDVARPAGLQAGSAWLRWGLNRARVSSLRAIAMVAISLPGAARSLPPVPGGDGLRVSQRGLKILIRGY